MQVSGTITVNSTLTLDAVDLQMAATSGIVVNSGGLLKIINGTELYASSEMWTGIIVNGGGEVEMSNSEIYHAYTGIEANNSGVLESVVEVSESCFTNNEIGIHFGMNSLPAASTSIVESSEFTAPNLISPLTGEIGDYGILVTLQDEEGFGIQIGNDDVYTPSTANYFHELGIAIRAHRSNITVQNCRIEDIDYAPGSLDLPTSGPFIETTNGSIGICATSIFVPNIYCTLQVGLTTTSGDNNLIEDVRYGIYAEDYVNTELHKNRIVSAAGTTYIMRNAIEVYGTSSLHNIKDNYIQNFNLHGIRMSNTQLGSIHIERNVISTNNTGVTGDYGIRLNDAANPLLFVSENDIDHVQTGIFANGYDDAEITLNEIDFLSPATGDVSYGIRVDNCADVLIQENHCVGNYSTGFNNVRGIHIESSAGFLADENLIEQCAWGFYLKDPSVNGDLSCNAMKECVVGIGMRDLGTDGIGPVGTLAVPSDNSWVPETSAIRAYCFGGGAATDGASLNTDWVYRTSPPAYNITDALTDVAFGSTDFDPTVTSSTGTPCYPSFRLTDDSITMLQEEMEYIYGDWISEYHAEEFISPNVYFKAKEFWKFITHHSYIIEYLEGDWLAAYNSIEAGNMPVFIGINDSMVTLNYAAAAELNDAIVPANDIEYYLQYVNTVFLNNLDSNRLFTADESTEAELKEIAEMNGGMYGEGIYKAIELLDTVLHVTDEYLPEKLFSTLPQTFSIFPNPVNFYFTIKPEIIDESYSIELLDLLGVSKLKLHNLNSIQLINTSSILPGFYVLRILTEKNNTQLFNLQIIR